MTDSAYIFVGGLAYELTEGDVITIFSQWGEIMDVNLPRDKETGKTKGFGFLMYEDQRSTVLAVDNMNGAQVLGRTIRVDHTRNYRQPGKKNEEGEYEEPEGPTYNAMPPVLEGSDASDSSESEPDDIDEEDPMAAYLRNEKKAAKKKDKLKSITDGTDGADKKRKDKKRKHEGESKEERRARKEEKRAKKDAKKLGLEGSKPIRVKEEEQPDRERDMNRVREDRSPAQSRNRRREDGYEDDDGASVPTWEKKKGRGDRDDWRDGKLELERERERDRARQRERDGRSTRPDYDRERNNERGSERHDSMEAETAETEPEIDTQIGRGITAAIENEVETIMRMMTLAEILRIATHLTIEIGVGITMNEIVSVIENMEGGSHS
ncbi:RNA-binding domain-containing protein, X-linked 2 [Kwoniella heveanensis CBS 569]|nr:RNA-binding domain-containing protein, X-linked 2 [Kwoniella heveanensis CBS 569]